MIFTILSILIGMYALVNYRKSLILFTVYQLFWYSTTFLNIGGLGLNANLVLPLWYYLLFCLKKNKYTRCKTSFPFAVPFTLIILSYIFSCFTATNGFNPEFNRSLARIFSQYVYIYLLWNVIETENDFKLIFKYFTYIMLFASVFGLIEYFLGKNVLLDYKVLLSNNTISVYDYYGLRGYRLNSIFEHPIGAGMMFGLYSASYFALLVRNSRIIPRNNLYMITALLCLPCVILTKMRTAIIFTAILFLLLLVNKKLTIRILKKLVIAVAIIVPILLYVGFENVSLITNLFSSDTSTAIGGSSLSMRLDQFDAIRIIIKQSPFFGLGETFRDGMIQNSLTRAAKGYEGIIFEQMSMHGYFGLFVTFVLVFYSIIIVPKKYKSKEVVIIGFAYWLAYLASSIPSFRTIFLYLIMFYYIKTSSEYVNIKYKVGKGH